MIELNITRFGGRGASSSATKTTTEQRTGLKGYFKPSDIRETLVNVAFKSGAYDLITDGYSIYKLKNAGLEYSSDKNLTSSVKRFDDKYLKDFTKQINDYKDISGFINGEEYKINNDYSFDTKRIKQAKTILGKGTQVGIGYDERFNGDKIPVMIFKNKKGEKGILLAMRKY